MKTHRCGVLTLVSVMVFVMAPKAGRSVFSAEDPPGKGLEARREEWIDTVSSLRVAKERLKALTTPADGQ